jgi:SAM-dependent methyltransferase
MPIKDSVIERTTFFADPALDNDMPIINEVFWSSLIGHIEQDDNISPRVVLDVGCHSGGLLDALSRRFAPEELFGVEPLAAQRLAASQRLGGSVAKVTLLDVSQWDQIPSGIVDLATSHETLYLEPDLRDFMIRVRRVLSGRGVGYIVLGCHAENPLWQTWKKELVAAGHSVYDHMPLEIMDAASSEGPLPSVQPLRSSGWVTYEPPKARFNYPDVQTMFDHHYRYKLIFRLRVADDRTTTS